MMSNEVTAKPQPDTLLGLGSSDGLGLLPERENLPPQIGRLLKPGMRFGQPVYSAEQMYAYAAQEVAAERERCAKLCIERAQLSWAAADQPHAPEVKMQHESVAAAMEELARELRA